MGRSTERILEHGHEVEAVLCTTETKTNHANGMGKGGMPTTMLLPQAGAAPCREVYSAYSFSGGKRMPRNDIQPHLPSIVVCFLRASTLAYPPRDHRGI